MCNRERGGIATRRRLCSCKSGAALFLSFLLQIEAQLAAGQESGRTPGDAHPAVREDAGPASAIRDSFGPVASAKTSVANELPLLLPFFNNAPVFGLRGTETGDLWQRTQLTGDWDGIRTQLAADGIFLDLYSTSAQQEVTSGGLETGSSFVQNTQLSLNLDTGRAGLWPGGLFHFTLDSRYGSTPEQTFTSGSSTVPNTGLTLPGPFLDQDVLPTEYFLLQALTPDWSVILGKLRIITLADQTLFGNEYRYDFANLAFNKNPMALNFYNSTTIAAVGIWAPTDWFTFAGGVFDPYSEANNFATDAFDKVNLYGAASFKYRICALPGQFMPQYNWSNDPKTDLRAPFGALSQSQIPQAVGVLLGSPLATGLPVNEKSSSWATIANFSQYLHVIDEPAAIAPNLKSGPPLRGFGVFGRLGYAPPEANPITRDASIALFANGLFERRYDRFGAGFYCNVFSQDLKDDLRPFTGRTVANEKGIELFYDFAITPAIRVIPSYQHVWNPLIADALAHHDDADVLLVRLTVAF